MALKRGFERTWDILFTDITAEELRAGQETEPAINHYHSRKGYVNELSSK